MVETRQLAVEDGDVVLLVGTTNGAFLFRSVDRSRWELSGRSRCATPPGRGRAKKK